MNAEITIKVNNIDKSFNVADGKVDVLKKISFEIFDSEFTIIFGPSGCGKSTLLHTILGLESPTSGEVSVLGKNVYTNYSEDSMAEFRIHNIGMVYQQSNWIKAINVVENVAFPLAILGYGHAERIQKAKELLDSLHLLPWAEYHPYELSSGQQQKAALARALIGDPKIIIADEPTGNLDYEAGEELISLFRNLSTTKHKTILMVTHDLNYIKHADKAIRMLDGKIVEIFEPKNGENGHKVLKYKTNPDYVK